jgi:hypothetical protein
MARDYSALKQHAKVHTFRITTVIVAWVLIVAMFYYRPDWIKWGLGASTGGIEAIGDALPYPLGDRVEIVLRELGGSFSGHGRHCVAARCAVEHSDGLARTAPPTTAVNPARRPISAPAWREYAAACGDAC